MNDQWNIAGGKYTNAFPSITSHYGYHMTVWHVLLALNGQDADLSDPANMTLAFNPKMACDSPGFEMPFLLPGACRCYAMLCYAILCYAMLCCAMLCYAMLCYAMLCYSMLYYAMLCYAMLCYMLCYAMLC